MVHPLNAQEKGHAERVNVKQSAEDYADLQPAVDYPLHDPEECHGETGELFGWAQLESQDAVAGVIVGKPPEPAAGGTQHTVVSGLRAHITGGMTGSWFPYARYCCLQTHYFSSHLPDSALI